MKNLLINSCESRLKQIKSDLIEQFLEKYSKTNEFITLKEELLLNDKKVTHILYRNLWQDCDLELYFDKENYVSVSIKDINNIYDLINIAKIIL